MLNPGERAAGGNAAGWAGHGAFEFDWIVDPDRAIYTIVIAAVWQTAGLVMALVLAGLRGVDDELWKAARVEGIPTLARVRRRSCCRCWPPRYATDASCCCSRAS